MVLNVLLPNQMMVYHSKHRIHRYFNVCLVYALLDTPALMSPLKTAYHIHLCYYAPHITHRDISPAPASTHRLPHSNRYACAPVYSPPSASSSPAIVLDCACRVSDGLVAVQLS